MPDTATHLKGCPCCGLVQQVPPVPRGHAARCTRCDSVIHRPGAIRSNAYSAAFALSALFLFPLGISLPVLRLEQMGHIQEASIWAGTVSLLEHGQWLVGIIVLLCSVVIPLAKIAGMFVLVTRMPVLAKRHRNWVYHAIEWAGRWGMIDVLLVAVLVAALKLGDLVQVHPGPGVVAFAAVVILSLLATAFFNPHAIWEAEY